VLLYDLTHSAGWVAAGSLARYVPSVLFSGYGGVLAERFERVRLMVWINVIALLIQAGLAIAAWRSAPALIVVALGALTAVVLLRSAQARLALTHPSSRALEPLLRAEDRGGAPTA